MFQGADLVVFRQIRAMERKDNTMTTEDREGIEIAVMECFPTKMKEMTRAFALKRKI